ESATMGNIVIPIPVPESWLRKDKRSNQVRALQTANFIFRLQVLALLLLTISTTLLGTANFANGGAMEDGRRKVFRRRYKCATRSLLFAFIAVCIPAFLFVLEGLQWPVLVAQRIAMCILNEPSG